MNMTLTLMLKMVLKEYVWMAFKFEVLSMSHFGKHIEVGVLK